MTSTPRSAVSVFILCYSPYFIFNLLQVFQLLPNTQAMTALSTFIQGLAPLNSAANPIIYCIFSGCDVCRAFRWVLGVAWGLGPLLEIRPFPGPGRVKKIIFSLTIICSRD